MAAVMSRLKDVAFVDLCIGEGYADLRSEPGPLAPRTPVPASLTDEMQQLRQSCLAMYQQDGEADFAIDHDGVLYRVAVMTDLYTHPVLFLRRLASDVRDAEKLGLSRDFLSWLLKPERTGLILVAGDMGAGKTTTAAALLVARLKAHGGLAIAIENPPETRLHGLHGHGRCIQVPASRKHGGYREQLRQAMRTGASMLLIGEIRDNATALEAIKHSNNGTCVISTAHGRQLPDALSRVVAHARCEEMPTPESQLADGLAAVIFQRLDRVERTESAKNVIRAGFRTLMLDGADEAGIRSKIRSQEFHQLQQDVDNQSRRNVWGA